MTKDDKEIVSALRLALAGRVGRELYDLWFGRVTLRLGENELTVVVPDPFTLERLRHKLRPDIEAACSTVIGRQLPLRFDVATVEARPRAGRRDPSTAPASGEGKPMSSAPLALVSHPAVRRESNRDATRRDDSLPERPLKAIEAFVAGPCNEVAATAARSVVARLGVASPLLLYGPNGCGKTHLLESILRLARGDRRLRRSMLLSAEQFTTQFLDALQGSGLPSFRRKYRDLDLLLIDDIQFLGGKKATLLEFQHTLDGLQRTGRQVVLAADRVPSELSILGSDIVARLTGGLVCGIEQADQSVRRRIVEQAAARMKLKLNPEILDYVAHMLPGDARRLIGALHRLDATVRAIGEPLTLEMAQRALVDLVLGGQRTVRLTDIERAVCHVFGLDARTLQSDSKSRSVTKPRMLAMWLARKYTRAGLTEIGAYFGRRSHTTVITAQRKMDAMMNDRATIRIEEGICSIHDAVRRVEGNLRTG